MDNVVLRGMSIQGNATVAGIVIYTGQDCLLFKHLNAGKAGTTMKGGVLNRWMNFGMLAG